MMASSNPVLQDESFFNTMKRKLDADDVDSAKVLKAAEVSFGPSFRKKLKTDNAINVLQEFVSANKEKDVVEQYINGGGSVKELIGLLKQFDGKKDFVVASTVFSAIQFIIVRSVSDLLLIQKNVEESCEELLCNYLATMQNMLGASSSSTSHRKVILKLLTAMVTLSSSLAKRILTLFPINTKLLRILTDARSSNSAQKLRTCFIHFILSFLVEGNTAIISELLQKKGLLTSIVPGMMNDRPETVVLILNTLRLKIVENIKISKTHKLHTFNTPVLRSLFKLYHYKRHNESQTKPEDSIADSATQTVRQATHELLVLLCTSHKKGILFREQRSLVSGKSPNQLILTLLEDIEAPHKDELQCSLVSEILKVCPEFIKNILTKLEPHLQPSVSESWISLMNLVIQVIEKQELSIQISNEHHAFSMISTAAFPPVLQKLLTREYGSDAIHEHPIIRFNVIRLLVTILRKIDQVLQSSSCNYIAQLREQTETLLNKTLIPCSTLVHAWKAGVGVNETENAISTNVDYGSTAKRPNVIEYYICLADLLLLYYNLAPTCFSELRLNEDVNIADDINGVDDAELRFKRAQLIFYIYSPKPNQDQFSCMMKEFIEYWIKSENSVPNDIIEKVFKSTGFFDGVEDEITVWLYSLKKVPVEHASVISDLFVKMLCTLGKKSKRYVEQLASIYSKVVGQNDCSTIAGNDAVFLENFESIFCLNEETEVSVKPSVGLSPAVPALLCVLKSYESSDRSNNDIKKTLQSYSSLVFVHLLHLQSEIEPLKMLLNKYSAHIDSRVFEYVSFWTNKKLKTNVFQYPLEFETIASVCSLKLIDGNVLEDDLANIADIDEMERIMLWNLCVFYLIHLNKMQMVDNVPRSRNIVKLFSVLQDHLRNENLVSCLKLLLTNPNCINNFNIETALSGNRLPHVLLHVVMNSSHDYGNLLPNYTSLVSPYRSRFLSLIMDRKERGKHINISHEGFSIENLIKFIALPSSSAVNVLHLLIQLPVNLLIDKQRENTSEWAEIVRCLLLTVAINLETPLESDDLITLILKLCELLKLNIIAVDLEKAIAAYIRSFPHHLRDIPEDLIQDLLTHHPGSGIDKLGSYLVSYHANLIPYLQLKILQNIEEIDTESVVAVLNAFKSSSTVDEETLSALYKSYFRDIRSLCSSVASLWLKDENIVWTIRAIKQCADSKSCSKTCDYIEDKWTELELNENKCSLLKVIFEKSDKVELFMKLLLLKLNQMLLANENPNWLCGVIINMGESAEDLTFLPREALWGDFVKLSLEISLQTSQSVLMRAFKVVCQKSFSEDHQDGVTTVFQMTISHSAFVNTILSDSDLKCELVSLFLILTTANVSLMSSHHVPLLLGAYKATLSKSDQLLLQVLQWYEESGIRFNDCRPYLWGDAAVTHHSIRTEISVSLKRQPFPNQVLDLLDVNVVKNTIRFFPLDRSLRPGKQLICLDCDVYDLSFMLPLMSHLLASESRISIQKFTRSGALCLILVALSSEDTDVRIAAFHCLQRFHSHLSSREKEIQIWYHFTNALKSGIRSSEDQADDEGPPRLPCLVTTFLAHMSLIISEPLHSLFVPLSNFLLAKPSFDVSTVPNFLMLYYSTDLKHREHQEWILKVIRDGMRFKKDWTVAQKCFLFKLLQQYYFSALSNETSNLLILQITAKALEIQNCKLFMVTKCGFLSWINQIVQNTSKNQANLFSWIIKMMKLLINAKNASSVLATSLLLTRKLVSINTSDDNLEDLLHVLSETYCLCNDKTILCESDIKLIIELASPLLDSRCKKLFENCLRYKSVIGLDVEDRSIGSYVIHILRNFVRT